MEGWGVWNSGVNNLAKEQEKTYPAYLREALTHTKGCQCNKCTRAGFRKECHNSEHQRGCQCGQP